jgi:hypothetical protein
MCDKLCKPQNGYAPCKIGFTETEVSYSMFEWIVRPHGCKNRNLLSYQKRGGDYGSHNNHLRLHTTKYNIFSPKKKHNALSN